MTPVVRPARLEDRASQRWTDTAVKGPSQLRASVQRGPQQMQKELCQGQPAQAYRRRRVRQNK